MKLLHRSVQSCSWLGLLIAGVVVLYGQTADPISERLSRAQKDLTTEGRKFLVQEGSRASFFLVGGLHGDNETQRLVQDMAQALEPFGYRYTAVEMSPWAANRLLASQGAERAALWGSDIEVIQPHLAIRELAAANPQNRALQSMSEMTGAGYRRSQAPALLQLAREARDVGDISVQGTSLRALILRTLEIEVERLDSASRLAASVHRETFMKELFVSHYRRATQNEADRPKVMVVFGQNHLHRGYDRRGVSTLGNFIAEFAAADGAQSFHVVLFAAGGKVSLGGLVDADQRKDDPAFEWLASLAKYPATVFDLRPLRQVLHTIPARTISAREASFLYWADSYDAILCYREVTPTGVPQPKK
jgi:hypothetical protein